MAVLEILKEPVSKTKIKSLIQNFDRTIKDGLYEIWSKTREELELEPRFWREPPKETRLPHKVLFGFTSESTNKLRFFSSMKIASSLHVFGLLPLSAKGKPVIRMKQGEKNIVQIIQELDIKTQKNLLKEIIENDELFESKFWSQSYIFSLKPILKIQNQSNHDAFFNEFSELFAHETNKTAKDHNHINLAVIWFAFYCFSKGLININHEAVEDNKSHPFFSTGFTPFNNFIALYLLPGKNDYLLERVIPACNEKNNGQLLRSLLLDRTFYNATDANIFFEALYQRKLKSLDENAPDIWKLSGQDVVTIRKLYREVRAFFSLAPEDSDYLEYFENNGKFVSADGLGTFSWLRQPNISKKKAFEEWVGCPQPNETPQELLNWAAVLEKIIPTLGVKTTQSILTSMDYWLLYLYRIYLSKKQYFPKDFTEVRRDEHIAKSKSNDTFINCLEQFIGRTYSADRALDTFQSAFYCGATIFGWDSSKAPINRKFDKIKKPEKRTFGTPREAMKPEVLNYITETNRKDDFAFAKQLIHGRTERSLYNRKVYDSRTGEYTEIFWPSIPFILDVMLTSACRSSSAISLDSGEGDKTWVLPSGEVIENHLPTAALDRSAGALTQFTFSATKQEKNLGIHFQVSKTGPYSVPYIEPRTAKNLQKMRELQLQYNPISGVVSLASPRDIRHGNKEKFDKIFPLFRDPISTKSHPPSHATLSSYWQGLLEHCEAEFKKEKGYFERFLIDGKPRWDLHSIRVTNITILLEQGVDPRVVAELAGHKSLAMTWHYKATSVKNIHKTLVEAHKDRQDAILQSFLSADDEDEIDRLLQDLIGSNSDLIETTDHGRQMLKHSVTKHIPPEVFSHGICPGADCSQGKSNTVRGDVGVWRPRACSGCKFRITGPAFLPGLVFRLNSLMAEIKSSLKKEAKLNEKIEHFEDQDKATQAQKYRLIAEAEALYRDKLFEEWALEYKTIRRSENMLQKAKTDSENSLILTRESYDRMSFIETEDFPLAHALVKEAEIFLDAEHELPDGVRERRNEILMEVASKENISHLFYKLSGKDRAQSMTRLGTILLANGNIDDFLSGEKKLTNIEGVYNAIDGMFDDTLNGNVAQDDALLSPEKNTDFVGVDS
ncbi:hypothetical protein WH95_13525 [Kiloniella litopenaei]|uniref:Tyr recombinase domain-containing protein n=1 Tax=Kiloniella litopenaei TaxID=1549748 RepID=A0A0M2R9I7_9PROT|nr:VPA1269 family protein [Kiloniella litopenaei]KKJ76243.1 hypothetical protein WH95_13525 [Kiloniella litopenaei]